MGRKGWLVCFWLLGISILLYAQEQKDIRLLQKGDWIVIESVEYYPFEAPGLEDEVPWRAENIRKVEVKATVIDVNTERISFDFFVQRVYDAKNNATNRSLSLFDSNYQYTHPVSFAPWFLEGYDHWKSPGKEDVLARGVYDLHNGALKDSICQYNNLYLYYYKDSVPYGLRKMKVSSWEKPSGVLDIAPVIWEELPKLLNSWLHNKSLASSLRTEADTLHSRKIYTPIIGGIPLDVSHKLLPRETRLVNASFSLPSNVTLIYKDISSSSSVIMKKIFIPHPMHYVMEDDNPDLKKITWLISPGDSVCANYTSNGKLEFSGKGREQNMFYYRQSQVYEHIFTPNTSKDKELLHDYEEIITISEEEFKQLDNFWQRTFELSDYYIQANRKLDRWNYNTHLKEDEDTYWNSPCFANIFPLADYHYFPLGYDCFLYHYVFYKKRQLATENLNKAKLSIPKADLKAVYSWGKLLLDGYPCYKWSANILREMFASYMLEDIRMEYEDFIYNCPDSLLVNAISKQHASLEELERGRNVKDTKLAMAKNILPRFGSGHKYFFIYINPNTKGNNQREEHFQISLREKGLEKNVKGYFFYPPKSSAGQSSLKESIKNDLKAYGYDNSMILLIREDGTILYREWDSLKSDNYFLDIIAKDLNRPQSDYLKGFWKGLFITGLAGLILILIFRYHLITKRRKEQQLRYVKELEIKAIRSQMNPHFIFNALSSIQNLINRGDLKEANEYLVQFSRLLRKVLNNSEKKLVTLSEEIEQLYLYLNLEQLRFPFTFSVLAEKSIEEETIEIPGMLIQPFVENAVKHAIAPRGKGEICIRVALEGAKLKIDILDDGPGFSSVKPGGFGIKAMNEEFEILKTLYQTDIGVEVLDRQEAEGVTGCHVILSIPIG